MRCLVSVIALILALVQAIGVVGAQTPPGAREEFPVFRVLERSALDSSARLEDRLTAIGGLADGRHPSTLPVLLALLQDPEAAIRGRAATALGWPDNVAALEPLVTRAGEAGEVPEVRVEAIGALGRIGAPPAAGPVEALSRDSDAQVRRAALLALFDSPLAQHADQIAAAVRMLEDVAQDGHVRSRAAMILGGAAGDPRVVAPLQAALRDPRPPAGYDALPAPDTLTGMQRTMAQRLRSLHNVRAHAAWALGSLRSRGAVPDLLAALADPDPAVRLRSAGALGRVGATEAVPGLVGALADGDALVRAMAATALGELNDRRAGRGLREVLRDDDARVRERAAGALGRIGDQDAREDLRRLAATDVVPSVRRAAYAALRDLDAAREGGGGPGGSAAKPVPN